MDLRERLEALQANLEAHGTAAGTMDAYDVAEFMDGMDTRWREAWKHLPRDMGFDKLYALRSGQPDHTPRPFLFRHVDGVLKHAVIDWSEDNKWFPVTGPDSIIEWLIENPPWKEYQPIADLYEHAASMTRIASPWIMMMTVIGKRRLLVDPRGEAIGTYVEDSRGPVPFSTLVPLGDNDAYLMGEAMKVWGNEQTNTMAREYIYLIDAYDSYAV